MSIPSKITLAVFLVTLMIVAGTAITSMYRPVTQLAPSSTVPNSPTPSSILTTPIIEINPFSASVINPFEDEEYSNPFTPDQTNGAENYLNPFANL